MIEYSNKSEAMRELNNLITMYTACRKRQEHLRSYIRNNGSEKDTKKELIKNRELLKDMTLRIRTIRKNVRRLDVESTQRDIARKIKESLSRQLKEE